MRTLLGITALVVVSAILVACGDSAVNEQVTILVETVSSPTPPKAPGPTETVSKPLPLHTSIPASVTTDTPTLTPANKPLPLLTTIPSSVTTNTATIGRTEKPIRSSTATPHSIQTPTEWNQPSGWNGEACSMPNDTIHVTSDGSVLYNTSSDIAGFQFDVNGATVLSGSGGEAEAQSFSVSTSATTVLGFSLSGATFSGCGTAVELSLDGEPTGLSGIIVSDPAGEASPFEYFDGEGSDY